MADERSAAERTKDASGSRSVPEEALPAWILGLLACPVDLGVVRIEASELVCDQCGRRFPVVAGVPRMISDQPEEEQRF